MVKHQEQVLKLLDKKEKSKDFQIGDLILLWDKRRELKGKHGKFDSLWKVPFKIHQICGKNNFFLMYQDDTLFVLPHSRQHLKHFTQ
jgi:hypothetical protein